MGGSSVWYTCAGADTGFSEGGRPGRPLRGGGGWSPLSAKITIWTLNTHNFQLQGGGDHPYPPPPPDPLLHIVTCRLYTPLYYRIGGRVRRQHYTWSPRTAGSLYQAAGNWTYHNVIVVVTGKRSVLRVYSSSRCKIYWSQGRCRLSQMNILFIQ